MKLPLRNFGRHGVVADTQQQTLPIGTWTDARNMRFTGFSFEKMYEPENLIPRDPETTEGVFRWGQAWSDGLSTYYVAATDNYLYFWRASDPTNGEWVIAGGPYETGDWQGFAWGDTVICNNGKGPPQIFNPGTVMFEDLPNWGLISNASDLTNNDSPSVNTAARCVCIQPLGSFLVALGVTESGLYRPNTIWWSDATPLVGYNSGIGGTGGPPSWDYESPATLSGKREIGVGDGALTWAAELNENLICYTERSATALSVTGGTQVMGSRRLFGNGCAALNLAAEYNNRHFVVSQDRIYTHDGSTIQEIAQDRVEEEFFKRAGKGGRFGLLSRIDYDRMQVVNDPDRKEINLIYDSNFFPEEPDVIPPYVDTVFATLLYEEPSDGETPRYTPEGCVGVYQNQIIANTGQDSVRYSADFGATWTVTGSLPKNFADGWRANVWAYHPGGAWFVHMENGGDREAEWWRTLDFGNTWQRMQDNAVDNFTSTAMIVDSAGRLVTAARGTYDDGGGGGPLGGMWIQRWPDPVNDVGPSTNELYFFRDAADNVDNLKEVGGGYAVSVWTGTEQGISFVPFSMDQVIRLNAGLTADDYTPWSFQLASTAGETDPELPAVAIFKTTIADEGIWDIFYEGSTVPLDQLQLSFNETPRYTRVQSADEFVVAVGTPQVGDPDPNRWICKVGRDFKANTFYPGATTVRMPTDVDVSSLQNLYWAGGYNFVGHYLQNGKTVIVSFNLGGLASSTREALVYNYEDDNYTFMDAAVNGDILDPVEWMSYGFLPGWQVRWSDLDDDGTTWQELMDAGTKWSDFYSPVTEEAMLWLTNKGLHRADAEILRGENARKFFYVERRGIDLDDLVPEWTTNLWKYISEFYFHLESPSNSPYNPNEFTIQWGWAENLMDDPAWEDEVTLNLQDTDSGGAVKFDTRTTGRYLSLRMRFNQTDEMKMSGADIEAQETHGR